MSPFEWGPPFPERRDPDDRFRRLWEKFPKKVAKLEAQKAFNKLNPSEAQLQMMLAALEWQCETRQWLEEEGKYIPHLATWIRSGRYLDEPPVQRRVAPQWDWQCPHNPACHDRAWCQRFGDARQQLRIERGEA